MKYKKCLLQAVLAVILKQIDACKPLLVWGLKLPSESCFYNLQSKIVSQRRMKIVGGIWINFGRFLTIVKPLLGTVLNIKTANNSNNIYFRRSTYSTYTHYFFGGVSKVHHRSWQWRWSNYRCYQYRWGTFAETPNVTQIFRVIWKDLWWRADSYRLLK